MNRFASTRSEKRARQPEPPVPQCSVGSIDDDGILYGFTTQALIARTIATAPTMVTIQSMMPRHGCGTPRRSSGFQPWYSSCRGGGTGSRSGRLGQSVSSSIEDHGESYAGSGSFSYGGGVGSSRCVESYGSYTGRCCVSSGAVAPASAGAAGRSSLSL